MNSDDKQLISAIVESMQEKKAQNITIVDMTKLEAPCPFFVICQAQSNTQVSAICHEVKVGVSRAIHQKPFAIDGEDFGTWIAMDYGTAIVHIFQPETRAFYDLEHLWEDADIQQIPDIL